MAATAVNIVATLNDQPGIAAMVDCGAGTAVDAANGNSCPNNGLVELYVTATAADAAFTVIRPEGPDAVYDIATVGHLYVLGPFETDEFGATLEWHGLATTTVRPVQLPIP